MQYRFIKENSDCFPIEELCDCFGLSRRGYYAWLGREPSARACEDASLKERIEVLYKQSKRRYGYRPIYHHLQDECRDCGRDRTLRLMNELGIAGTHKKGFKPLCTDSNHNFGYTNLLRELAQPDRVDQVWVADTTYLRAEESW